MDSRLNSALVHSPNFEGSKMAVMKTCCGCLSTQSGTMTILLLYSIGYIAGIIYSAVAIDDLSVEQLVADHTSGDNDCKTGDNKDTWWCNAVDDLRTGIEGALIAAICVFAVFLIVAIIAIYGTSKGKHWLMLPWIILEFVFLVMILVMLVISVVLMSVYMSEGTDSSSVIALGVISAAFMAFLFYLWLCVVSHFQILREVSKLGLNSLENIQPFYNEFDQDSHNDHQEEVKTEQEDYPDKDEAEVDSSDDDNDDDLNKVDQDSQEDKTNIE